MKTFSVSFKKSTGEPQAEFVAASTAHPIYCVAAGAAGQTFCDALVQATDQKFSQFNEKHTAKLDVFRDANAALKSQLPNVVLAPNVGVSAGFVILQDKKCSWATIGPVDFYLYNAQGEKTFHGTHPFGYQLANGTAEAEKYLVSDVREVIERDIVFLATEGFRPYFELPEFIKFFTDWPENLQVLLETFMKIKISENPEKYGAARTLIGIKI